MATSSPVNRLSILFNLKGNTFYCLGLMLLASLAFLLSACQKDEPLNEWATTEDAIAWYNEIRAGGGTEAACFTEVAQATEIVDGNPTIVAEAENDPYTSTVTEGAVYPRKRTTIEVDGSTFYIYQWNTDEMQKESSAVDAAIGISTANGINRSAQGGKCFVISNEPL